MIFIMLMLLFIMLRIPFLSDLPHWIVYAKFVIIYLKKAILVFQCALGVGSVCLKVSVK